MAATNLYDFYQGKLPSLQERSTIYQTAGLGSANTYSGTAEQNTSLLGYLQKTPTTGGTPNINSETTKPQTLIDTTAPAQTSNGVGTTLPLAETTTDTADTSTTKLTGESARIQGMVEEILKNQNIAAGRTTYQEQQEQAAGIPGLTTLARDLSNQLKQAQQEAAIIYADPNQSGQSRGISQAQADREKNEALRQNSIKSNLINAQFQIAQGNLQSAQDSADRATNLKYAPIEASIKAAKENLDLIINSPEYTTQEKAQARAEQAKQDAKQAKVEKEKQAEQNKNTTLINWQGKYRDAGITMNDSIEVANEKIQNSLTYKAEVASLSSETAYKNMQIRKLQSEINATGTGEDPAQLMAYAQQYASTGQIPTGLPKGTFGMVSQTALEIPKANGSIVNKITGVADSKTPATEQQDYSRLYNIINNVQRLKELDEQRIGGVVAGTLGKVFGSTAQNEYLSVRKAIVDDMQRMQSGAALTPTETAFYEDYLPGRFSESFTLGQDSLAKINNFEKIMNNRLNERLAVNNLAIQGFTKVDIGGQKYTVGDIIRNAQGQTGRVNANGTITIVQ